MTGKALTDYRHVIEKLPNKEKLTKEDLFIEELLVDRKGNVEVFYAPHNEYINKEAKIMIVGITPGFEQMTTAIGIAKRGLNAGIDISEIQRECKSQARFSGAIRRNLVSMMDEIAFNKILRVKSCSELFETTDGPTSH